MKLDKAQRLQIYAFLTSKDLVHKVAKLSKGERFMIREAADQDKHLGEQQLELKLPMSEHVPTLPELDMPISLSQSVRLELGAMNCLVQ